MAWYYLTVLILSVHSPNYPFFDYMLQQLDLRASISSTTRLEYLRQEDVQDTTSLLNEVTGGPIMLEPSCRDRREKGMGEMRMASSAIDRSRRHMLLLPSTTLRVLLLPTREPTSRTVQELRPNSQPSTGNHCQHTGHHLFVGGNRFSAILLWLLLWWRKPRRIGGSRVLLNVLVIASREVRMIPPTKIVSVRLWVILLRTIILSHVLNIFSGEAPPHTSQVGDMVAFVSSCLFRAATCDVKAEMASTSWMPAMCFDGCLSVFAVDVLLASS
ncbi:hypothetical protein ACLOJK_011691 [Asimina triloba]